MPRGKQFLLEQIARAQRFAKAMNTEADRECFEKMVADYQGTGVRGIGGGSIVCRSDRIAVRGPTNGMAKAHRGPQTAMPSNKLQRKTMRIRRLAWRSRSHMKAMTSPNPTRMYRLVTVTPRQTSAMTTSDGTLDDLAGTASPAHLHAHTDRSRITRAIVPPSVQSRCGCELVASRRPITLGDCPVQRSFDRRSLSLQRPSRARIQR
jgi:hypothetical protein